MDIYYRRIAPETCSQLTHVRFAKFFFSPESRGIPGNKTCGRAECRGSIICKWVIGDELASFCMITIDTICHFGGFQLPHFRGYIYIYGDRGFHSHGVGSNSNPIVYLHNIYIYIYIYVYGYAYRYVCIHIYPHMQYIYIYIHTYIIYIHTPFLQHF